MRDIRINLWGPLTVKSETAIEITAINSQVNLIKNYEKVTKF